MDAEYQPPATRIRKLLETERSWLYRSEVTLLESFLKQADAGHALSKRQLAVLRKITARISKRHAPRFMSGGGPGTGKRR